MTSDQLTIAQRHLVATATNRLKDEFAGAFAQETIERFIADSLDQMSSPWAAATPVRSSRAHATRIGRLPIPPVSRSSEFARSETTSAPGSRGCARARAHGRDVMAGAGPTAYVSGVLNHATAAALPQIAASTRNDAG